MEPRGLHLDPSSHAYKRHDLEQGLCPVRLSLPDHERVIIVPPSQEAVDEMKQVKPFQRRLKRSWLPSSAVIATITRPELWERTPGSAHTTQSRRPSAKAVFHGHVGEVHDLDKQPSERGWVFDEKG